jgi:hypothetical protein
MRRDRAFITNQLRNKLETLWNDEGRMHRAKREVIDQLLKTLRVHPVSAVEYEALLSEDGARLQDVGETNVPAIATSLQEIHGVQEQDRSRRVETYFQSVRDGVVSEIRLVQAQWTDESRRADEIEQLRKDLETFMLPLRTKFATLQGQYREFLRHTAPQRIADLVKSGKERYSFLREVIG